MTKNLVLEERVAFSVSADQCEGILAYPEAGSPTVAVLLLAPHPLLGGTMDNNVVRHLARRAAEDGAVTLRFNYRGVGASSLQLQEGQSAFTYFEEVESAQRYEAFMPEVRAALQCLQESSSSARAKLVIVGYSLGAVLAGMLAVEAKLGRIICISPPNRRVSMNLFENCGADKVFLAGTHDPFFEPAAFAQALARFPAPKRFVSFPGSDHFYRGEEEAVYLAVKPHLLAQPESTPASACAGKPGGAE